MHFPINRHLFLAAVIGLACHASAAEYRIGSDAELREISAQLAPGDTLIVTRDLARKGVVLSGLKGRDEFPLRVTVEPGTTIVPERIDGILIENCEHLLVEGVRVRNAKRAGILASGSRHIEIRNCQLADNGRWGIQTCLSDAVVVEDCDVSGSREQHGIYFSTTDHPVVRNCRVYGNASCGIHLNGDKNEGGDGIISGGLIENNLLYGNGSSGGAAVNMDSVENTIVRNNLIVGNFAGGIASFCIDGARAGHGNVIRNNLVRFGAGQGRYALQLFNGSANATVEGNLLHCGRGAAVEIDDASLRGLQSNRNIFCALKGRDPILVGEDLISLAQWRRKSGQDQDSIRYDAK